jgi:hypothetical protein
MYARSLFEQRYGAYVKKRMVELRLDVRAPSDTNELERIATNEVRRELGFRAIGERYVTETELFRIMKNIFPDDEVIHHYRQDWLEGLEVDIFVVGHRLAIEYHGLQHFEPIEAWGGETGLTETRTRDAKKATLCQQNKVTLVVFTYEEDITPDFVRKRIQAVLSSESIA